MNYRKLILTVAVLTLFTSVYAKPKIRLAPGASCFVWNENTKFKPSGVPNGGFVDEGNHFCAKNIHACEELKAVDAACFIMWEGYLQVLKTDEYRFSLVTNGRRYVKVFLNGKSLMVRNTDGKKTIVAQATMKRGFVKIRIYYNPNHAFYNEGHVGFSLWFGSKMAMKMTNITPSVLFHPVDSER